MKPPGLATRLFLDSGDPDETKEAIVTLSFLDGQTTNPTLIAKHPAAKKRLASGHKFTQLEIFDFYKDVVQELSGLLQNGSISIEVYADAKTTADTMFGQGRQMFGWIPNAHIKYPTTIAGLEAAERSVAAGMRVNMTLCFNQAQAAAVYAATRGAKPGQVYVSPFIGRLDDRGENGMDLIKNIVQMYAAGDGHVQVLAASIRGIDHLLSSFQAGSDIVTAPLNIYQEWVAQGMKVPNASFSYTPDLKPIPYLPFDLDADWHTFDVSHELTDAGIAKFSADWNNLVQ